MSAIDNALKANETYARDFKLGSLAKFPARKLAVLACMDCRLTVEEVLGLKTGDAHLIRNAGGVVTEDALRSLLISHHLLHTEEWLIINHTECGMVTFRDEELVEKLEQATGKAAASPAHFHTFKNLEANVRRQIQRLRDHPWVPKQVAIRGFVFDVKTGRLKEVVAAKVTA